MSDPIRVRRAVPSDVPVLVPLFDGYRRFYRQASEPGRIARFLDDRIRNGDSVVFLGYLGDEPAPSGFVQLYPIFSSISLGRALILNDLFVAPAARGHGLARGLMERAAAFGRDVGARYLELSTQISNSGAQRLYEGAGWARETEFLHYELDLG